MYLFLVWYNVYCSHLITPLTILRYTFKSNHYTLKQTMNDGKGTNKGMFASSEEKEIKILRKNMKR